MAEHDLDVHDVLGGFMVACRPDPSTPYTSPPGDSPPDANKAYKFLSDYAAANVKPGDTVRVNGTPFSSVDEALRHLKKRLNPPPPKRNFIGSGGRRP